MYFNNFNLPVIHQNCVEDFLFRLSPNSPPLSLHEIVGYWKKDTNMSPDVEFSELVGNPSDELGLEMVEKVLHGSANTTVDSSKPMTITWDTSCFNPAPTAIDIYMTAPLNADPNIHSWTNIDYAKGTVNVDLKPKWWNSTSFIAMELNDVQTGTPSFLTEFPAAPVFNVTYDASAAATNSQVAAAANTDIPDSPYTSVNNVYHSGGLSKGALASAGDGRAVLSDFSLASLANLVIPEATNTQPDYRVNTFRYQAPEVILDQPISMASDVYSWAMTALEIITGDPPYHTLKFINQVIMQSAIPNRSDYTSPVLDKHPEIWNLFVRSWNRQAAERPAVMEIVEVLESIPASPEY
ncbi:hypothetical protein FRC05_006994 [Tulasnella sp. 425]|nr:hypothetical protein FRC05_006994 [Tulasnella sp. 425]